VNVSREVAATTPPSRPPRCWNGEGEVLGVVPLLRAEEESQVGLVLPEDVRPLSRLSRLSTELVKILD